jgi:hypothetical protein
MHWYTHSSKTESLYRKRTSSFSLNKEVWVKYHVFFNKWAESNKFNYQQGRKIFKLPIQYVLCTDIPVKSSLIYEMYSHNFQIMQTVNITVFSTNERQTQNYIYHNVWFIFRRNAINFKTESAEERAITVCTEPLGLNTRTHQDTASYCRERLKSWTMDLCRLRMTSPHKNFSLLGTFTKLRKATISYVIFVRLSVRPHRTTRLPLDRYL